MPEVSQLSRCLALVVLVALWGLPALAEGVMGRQLQEALATREPGDRVAVIIRFSGTADRSALEGMPETQRRAALPGLLRDHARTVQAPVRDFLQEHGAVRLKTLWIDNALAASVPAGVVAELAAMPEVSRVDFDAPVGLPAPVNGRR